MGNSGLVTEEKELTKKELARLTTPSKAAEIIVEGMQRDRYRVLVGSDSKFLDFYYRLNPKSAAAFISKMMKGAFGL
jgi:hypothetical protein